MPLTRRVQVFISEEASKDLDALVAKHGSQRAAIEFALGLAVDPPYDPLFSNDIINKTLPLERERVPIPKLGKTK